MKVDCLGLAGEVPGCGNCGREGTVQAIRPAFGPSWSIAWWYKKRAELMKFGSYKEEKRSMKQSEKRVILETKR